MDNVLHPQLQEFIRGPADYVTKVRIDEDEAPGKICLRDANAYVIENDFELLFALSKHRYNPLPLVATMQE
jgi:hypothetical protein